jgi:hypothetical protein
VRESSRITSKFADRNPYRGGLKGRVKWLSVNFDTFFRDQAAIVTEGGFWPNPAAKAHRLDDCFLG